MIEGPSRVGHYFRGAYATATGAGAIEASGPIIRPDGRMHKWTFHYLPRSSGDGKIIVQFDLERHTFIIPPDHRKQGASFDRFGLSNIQVGGHFVDITFDDVSYTVRGE